MKMLLQIIFAIIVIVGLFLLLGFMVKEQRNINEVKVIAPIELCWDIYNDESRISEWMEGVTDIQLIAGETGRVGAKHKIMMAGTQGSSISTSTNELQRTITQISKPTRFSYDYANSLMDGRSDITFFANDSITTIKSIDAFSGKKLWLRSTLFLMKSSINQKTQTQFDKLKVIIENEHRAQLKQEAESQTGIIGSGIEKG